VPDQASLPDVVETLISRASLHERIRSLASELADALPDDGVPVAISILKGSTLFLADLIRAMDIPLEVDFMSITSYGGSNDSSGVVRIVKDLDTDISDRNVLIVEDIVDTGLTLTYLRRTLGERAPRSLRTVTLLDKAARRIIPVPLEHKGFEIPDVFVVGYGMDLDGRFRNVPDILAVKDQARLGSDPSLLADAVYEKG
jgi:hypoxanthine phosphoribosyltransferase